MTAKLKEVHGGFIATTTVLVLMVVTLSITTTVSLLGIGEGQGVLAQTRGEQALALTEGCVENALLGIKKSNSYTGGAVTTPEGSCLVTINSRSGSNWSITVENAATDYKKAIKLEVVRLNTVSVLRWQEI